jgi:hypothetical protein
MLSARHGAGPSKDSSMNPLSIIIGFVPQIVFTMLVTRLPLGWAAAAGAAAAVALIAVTAARGGVKILPVVQAVVLAAFTVAGFTAGHQAATAFAPYARGISSLALGAFILATSSSFPFTAQFARDSVPPRYWKSPQFLGFNRRISIAWGLAVLAVGASHLAAALLGDPAAVLRILLDWGIPAVAAYGAYSFTRRVIADNARSPRPGTAEQPAAPPAG